MACDHTLFASPYLITELLETVGTVVVQLYLDLCYLFEKPFRFLFGSAFFGTYLLLFEFMRSDSPLYQMYSLAGIPGFQRPAHSSDTFPPSTILLIFFIRLLDRCQQFDLPLGFKNEIVRTVELGKIVANSIDLCIDLPRFKHMVANELRQIANRFERYRLVEEIECLLAANPHHTAKIGTIVAKSIVNSRMGDFTQSLLQLPYIAEVKKITLDLQFPT